MADLRICTFSGVGALPVFAAHHLGFSDRMGLETDVVLTRSSVDLMQGLIDGSYHVVHAAPDNVVAWADRTGTDLRSWIGGSVGPLSLASRPEFGTVADLHGASIAVDAVTSGFVGVLRSILRANGLGDEDYVLDEVGATRLRVEALAAGMTDATLLNLPWTLRAESSGSRILQSHDTVLSRYQSFAGSSRFDWLSASPDIADAYLRSIVSATTWLYDPSNRGEVVAFAADLFSLPDDEATASLDMILDPLNGMPPSALLDAEGMATVCSLRAETAGTPLQLSDAYLDMAPYRRVFSFGAAG